jgi:hypothetical protein
MIQNCDKFSRWNEKSTHFEIFLFIQQWLTQNLWYIGATICIFNKKFEKKLTKKFFHTEKWKRTKKDSQSFCKIISLAPLIIFAPKCWYNGLMFLYVILECILHHTM